MKTKLSYKSVLLGIVLGALIGFATGFFVLPLGPPRWIMFPDRGVHDWTGMRGYVTVQGRINDRPSYPNSAVQITCRQSTKTCEMFKVTEIDDPAKNKFPWPLIGNIDPPELFDVVQWNKAAITAAYDETCETHRLNVDLAAGDAEVVIQPHSLEKMECRNTSSALVRYPLQEPYKAFERR